MYEQICEFRLLAPPDLLKLLTNTILTVELCRLQDTVGSTVWTRNSFPFRNDVPRRVQHRVRGRGVRFRQGHVRVRWADVGERRLQGGLPLQQDVSQRRNPRGLQGQGGGGD